MSNNIKKKVDLQQIKTVWKQKKNTRTFKFKKLGKSFFVLVITVESI